MVKFSSILLVVVVFNFKNSVECKFTTLSHQEAVRRLSAAGISLNCDDPNRNNKSCTSLQDIKTKTISNAIGFKNILNSNGHHCPFVITGGTEHAHGTRSGPGTHRGGYKYDLRLQTCIKRYVANNMRQIGEYRATCNSARTPFTYTVQKWISRAGNKYTLECDHWDINIV